MPSRNYAEQCRYRGICIRCGEVWSPDNKSRACARCRRLANEEAHERYWKGKGIWPPPPPRVPRPPKPKGGPRGRPKTKWKPATPVHHDPFKCGCGIRAAWCPGNPDATEVTPTVKRCAVCTGLMPSQTVNGLPLKKLYCGEQCAKVAHARKAIAVARRLRKEQKQRAEQYKNLPRLSPGPAPKEPEHA